MKECHGSGVDDEEAGTEITTNKIEQRGAKQGRKREKRYVRGVGRRNDWREATIQ